MLSINFFTNCQLSIKLNDLHTYELHVVCVCLKLLKKTVKTSKKKLTIYLEKLTIFSQIY